MLFALTTRLLVALPPTMPPAPLEYQGRDPIARFLTQIAFREDSDHDVFRVDYMSAVASPASVGDTLRG